MTMFELRPEVLCRIRRTGLRSLASWRCSRAKKMVRLRQCLNVSEESGRKPNQVGCLGASPSSWVDAQDAAHGARRGVLAVRQGHKIPWLVPL